MTAQGRWFSSSALQITPTVEIVGDVHHPHLMSAGLAQAGADLQQTTRVRRHHQLRAGLQNVLNLSTLQSFSHPGLGQVVTAGAATADIGFRQFGEIFSGDPSNQFPRRRGDALRMGKVAGIVIGNP